MLKKSVSFPCARQILLGHNQTRRTRVWKILVCGPRHKKIKGVCLIELLSYIDTHAHAPALLLAENNVDNFRDLLGHVDILDRAHGCLVGHRVSDNVADQGVQLLVRQVPRCESGPDYRAPGKREYIPPKTALSLRGVFLNIQIALRSQRRTFWTF